MNNRSASEKTIYIVCSNHFDPIWRRGFKKPFNWNNEKYVGSYKIQEACLDDWLEICKDTEASFEVECSLVLRTYLENNPDKLAEIRALALDGRFELRASGEVVPDTNMPTGETLVRNLILGLLWGEEILHMPAVTGCLNDTFGSSAQLPQIFIGCGINVVAGLSYNTMDNKFWRGLDGSIIRVINNPGDADFSKNMGNSTYYKPCPACKGEGCNNCNQRGFDQSYRMDGRPDQEGINIEDSPFGIIMVGGEETMAPMDLVDRVHNVQKDDNSVIYRFGLYKDIVKKHYEPLKFSDNDYTYEDISTKVEANPAQTASYTTRIKVKQYTRALEYNTMNIEKLSLVAEINGGIYPKKELIDIWRNIALAAFHDSITGTHVDVGYEELMELFGQCNGVLGDLLRCANDTLTEKNTGYITVFNPHAYDVTDYVPIGESMYIRAENVPTMSFKLLELPSRRENSFCSGDFVDQIENEYYVITFDRHGIIGILDKEYDRQLFSLNKGYVNELILEHDIGDPWSTREAIRPRIRLGGMGNIVYVRKYENYSEICIKGHFAGNEDILCDPADYRVLALEWEQKIILFDGLKRVNFETSVYWNTFDRRIRVSFPTYMKEDEGYYAIPYGVLKRKRYDRVDLASVANPEGDWASVEWFSTAKGHDVNIALLNKGTPASRIEKGEMMISLLRSPTFPGGGLLWPKIYDAPVYQGMRDQGEHKFEYALTSFFGEYFDSHVSQMAYQYNSGLVVMEGTLKPITNSISIQAHGTELGACKMSESGDDIIIRLNEFRGKSETVVIKIPLNKKAFETNLLERELQELLINDGMIYIDMKPYQIKTIRLCDVSCQ